MSCKPLQCSFAAIAILWTSVTVWNGPAEASEPSKHSETIRVGCKDSEHFTIQGAIDEAEPNAVIKVCPGIYEEQLDITKSLTIVGISRKKSVSNKKNANRNLRPRIVPSKVALNLGTKAALVYVHDPIEDDAKIINVHLKNLVVDGTNINSEDFVFYGTASGKRVKRCRALAGIRYENASGSIKNNVVRNIHPNYGPEVICTSWNSIVAVTGENTKSTVVVRSNVVDNYLKNGITGSGLDLTIHVRDNVVKGPGIAADSVPNGIHIGNGAKGLIAHNKVTGNIWTGCDKWPSTEAPHRLSCVWPGTGISLFGTAGVRVLYNVVGASNVNVVVQGDDNIVRKNTIFGAFQNTIKEQSRAITVGPIRDSRVPAFDGMNNRILENRIVSSQQIAIELKGANNKVADNQFYGAPIGILNCANGSKIEDNEFYQVDEELNSCE